MRAGGPARVRQVGSFTELLATPFAGDVNALCWERTLPGDYAEVIARLGAGNGIVPLDDERLQTLNLSPAGQLAAEALLASQPDDTPVRQTLGRLMTARHALGEVPHRALAEA